MKILAVCLGNICRSPIAHGLLLSKINKLNLNWEVDSAGTSGYHKGAQPHHGSIDITSQHGIDISDQQSRQLTYADIQYYDLILVMDSSNYNDAMALTTSKSQEDKIKLILNYVNPERNQAVPDPYYEGGFDKVYDMLDKATDKVIEMHRSSAS